MKEAYTAHYAGEQDGLHVWNVKGPGIDRLISVRGPKDTAAEVAMNAAEDLNIAYAAGRDAK